MSFTTPSIRLLSSRLPTTAGVSEALPDVFDVRSYLRPDPDIFIDASVPSKLLVLDGAHDHSPEPGGLAWLASVGLVTRVGQDLRPLKMLRPVNQLSDFTRVALYAIHHDPNLADKMSSLVFDDQDPDGNGMEEGQEWFNIMALHQNIAGNGGASAPPGKLLPLEAVPTMADIVLCGGRSHVERVDPDEMFEAEVPYFTIYPGTATRWVPQAPGDEEGRDLSTVREDAMRHVDAAIAGAVEGADVSSVLERAAAAARAVENERRPPKVTFLMICGDSWQENRRELRPSPRVSPALTELFARPTPCLNASIRAPITGGLLRAAPAATPASRRVGAAVELPEDAVASILTAVAQRDDGVQILCSLALLSRRMSSLVNRALLQLLILQARVRETPNVILPALLRVSAWTPAMRQRDLDANLLASFCQGAGLHEKRHESSTSRGRDFRHEGALEGLMGFGRCVAAGDIAVD